MVDNDKAGLTMSERILENEAMLSEPEVIAYDKLVKQYHHIMHAGFVLTVLNTSPEKGAFLDVGTGTGWIAIGIAKCNPKCSVTAIDLSDTMLNVAKKNAQNEGVGGRIQFLIADAKSIPFEDHTFDSIFSHNMLHHIPNPIAMVNEMVRVVKEDGAINIRDLIRVPKFMAGLYVNIFGMFYNKMMKKEYHDSILASLSAKEWHDLLRVSKIRKAKLTAQFVTHISIERSSIRKRNKTISIPGPSFLSIFKKMYVSG